MIGRPYRGEVTEELKKIYANALKEGIWIQEIVADRGRYLAAAGRIEKLKEWGRAMKLKINLLKLNLSLADIVSFGLGLLGSGRTRESACKDAIAKLKILCHPD